MLKASQASHKGRKVWILFTKKILSFLKEFQITKKKKKSYNIGKFEFMFEEKQKVILIYKMHVPQMLS